MTTGALDDLPCKHCGGKKLTDHTGTIFACKASVKASALGESVEPEAHHNIIEREIAMEPEQVSNDQPTAAQPVNPLIPEGIENLVLSCVICKGPVPAGVHPAAVRTPAERPAIRSCASSASGSWRARIARLLSPQHARATQRVHPVAQVARRSARQARAGQKRARKRYCGGISRGIRIHQGRSRNDSRMQHGEEWKRRDDGCRERGKRLKNWKR